jgi:CRP-like cAMP-binding protein
VKYEKGCVIYDQRQPSTSLFLVIDGRVTVFRSTSGSQQQILLDIYRADELFGYSALLNLPHMGERATALEKTRLMSWTAAEITDLIQKKPRLAVALIQLLAPRAVGFGDRVQILKKDNTRRRLALSLIHFADRFGMEQIDGSVRIIPLTHELLARYIGSTRETVSMHMKQFRQGGYLTYSRRGINLYKKQISEWLWKP